MALLLGPKELADALLAQFGDLGFDARYGGNPRTEDELAAALGAFRDEARASGAGRTAFVHPGLSLWADAPEFPQIVQDFDLTPVSPSSRHLSLFQNKVNLLAEAEAAGIPHLAVSLDPLSSLREIQALIAARSLRYPLVLKSSRSAMGYGIQLVRSEEELVRMAPLWFDQLRRHYGDLTVLVERSLPSARHLIVPYVAFPQGEVVQFPWVDASLQSRWKRMIQFAPATHLDEIAVQTIHQALEAWTKHTQYAGFGTLEFLVDGRRVALIDGLGRLMASFPLWEGIHGTSTLHWQLAALGMVERPEAGKAPGANAGGAYGVSMRLYAEDPVRQIPTPGWIQEMTEPREWNLGDAKAMFLTSFRSGQEMPPDHTGVLGEVFVFSHDRKPALQAAQRALRDIWISGSIQTNQRFMIEHLENPFVRENLIHAGFTDDEFIPQPWPESALIRKMVTLAAKVFEEPGAAKPRWIVGSQWIEPEAGEIALVQPPEYFVLREGAVETAVALAGERGASGVAKFPDFTVMRFCLFPQGKDRWLARLGDWAVAIRRVSAEDAAKRPAATDRRLVALASGRIHALLQREGVAIEPHESLLVLESLGNLVPHAVAARVKVGRWLVRPDERVRKGQELATIELLR